MTVAVVVAMIAATVAASQPPSGMPYQDPDLSIDTRVPDLLARMTAREKFWQLFMLAGGLDDVLPGGLDGGLDRYEHGAFGFQLGVLDHDIDLAARADQVQRYFVEGTRLGIPVIFFAEALHGLVQRGATVFPQAIGLAATFDPTLVGEIAAAIADECRLRGIRQVLSPVVNIASDVRWGRTEETYGEDPYLTTAMGIAFVAPLERAGIITTPKHLAANVGDGGRDSYPIHWSQRYLREIHLPPFAACIRQGGSRSVMTAYNSLDGTPCTANVWLNRTMLKDELAFTGFVISDAGAVGGANVLHMTAADYGDAAAQAVVGGLDVIFQTSFDHHVLFKTPFLDGRVASEVIDRAVARVLRAKFELGLFENPYVGTIGTPADRRSALARRAARASVVLLKNENTTLPLGARIRSVAVLGPDAAEARLGGYSAPCDHAVSILDGIVARAGRDVAVAYERGCARVETTLVTVPATQLSCERGAGLMGEYFANIDLAGAPALVRVDPQIAFQWTLFSPDPARLPYDQYSARWTGFLTAPVTGTHRIGIDGNDGYRLFLDDTLIIDNLPNVTRRTRVAEFHFEAGRRYDLRLEYHEPAGDAWLRLVWDVGVPANADRDRDIDAAVALAARSDAAVVAAGIEEGEFRDRASLALPGRQEELIRKVAATGTPTIVVLVGGSAITMGGWLDAVAAVLAVWYPGEQGGHAVAEVLFGDDNPAGRLPISYPVAEGQLPLVYNHKPTGRGGDYADLTGRPLFPFGHGLSYTTFGYADLRIEPPVIGGADTATVRCAVTNTGMRAGDEVVQLYLRDELASVARPVRELKGFSRIHLAPGEIGEVVFAITPELLSFLGPDLKPVVEPGTTRVMVGASSQDIRLHGVLTVSE
ncbi:MAG: glycoside hydrolase family 3 C-terminal domain-containing protein [Candidatus Krumholzibacteria bacterium]|jgi:beta-glucosidase|nr:glycoside hydrolase family 3 C-terminal domain-containing protein [Candidatus Krumholzibacteria bacterium]